MKALKIGMSRCLPLTPVEQLTDRSLLQNRMHVTRTIVIFRMFLCNRQVGRGLSLEKSLPGVVIENTRMKKYRQLVCHLLPSGFFLLTEIVTQAF